MNFSIFKSQNGVNLPHELMWRVGPAGELTWRAGPLRKCDVALRPRGRAAGGRARSRWRRARADMWQEATRSTRVHVDARVGCHVAAEGRHMEGPRDSGPW